MTSNSQLEVAGILTEAYRSGAPQKLLNLLP